jgi:methyl-accepting chemotaxis protein
MQQIKDLELVSRKIDKIVDAITQVSIQTNMLAVNGSIEAARAGDFGKGFVVVATDIRNLAHDSAENADRIKDLVKSIQDQIGPVGRDLAEIMAASADRGGEDPAITGQPARDRGRRRRHREGQHRGGGASQEIATALAQVKVGVDQVSPPRRRPRRPPSRPPAAAKQQSQGAEELSAAIEEIASLADELQSN